MKKSIVLLLQCRATLYYRKRIIIRSDFYLVLTLFGCLTSILVFQTVCTFNIKRGVFGKCNANSGKVGWGLLQLPQI